MVYEKWGFKPKTFDLIKVLTSMFIHAGFFHLLFNMLYLWLVGCNIEDDWSWPIFLGVYFISGFFAVLLHTAFAPKSTVPLVGASGAIAGIMGAFMVRHFKTRIRFAYFIWVIITRPYMGTFSVYAGVALPIWFLIELACAPGSGQGGTAHWAHIGGFVFGALVGVAMRFFHLEKKYVAPMVEDSFEKLKMSFKMKEATRKMDEGDITGALPLLIACLGEEPGNYDAALMLARIHHEKNRVEDAAAMYNEAVKRMIEAGDADVLYACYEEIKEKELLCRISEQNIFQSALFFEEKEDFSHAVRLYGMYIVLFPEGRVRAKAIHRAYLLFKNKLNKPDIAAQALDYMQQEYPDHTRTA
jgi:membrane associated rhomboid family serine protease